jgi:TonB family protein
VAGVVVLTGHIGTDGFIADLRELAPSNPELTASAMEAVRQWQFDATLLNCIPVDVAIKITVKFALDQ